MPAGRSVLGKTVTEVLKMLPEAAGRGCILSPRSQVFTIQTDPKPVNTFFIFSKLSNEKKLTEKKNSRESYCDRGQR